MDMQHVLGRTWYRQSAPHNARSALDEAAIQLQSAICQMNSICFRCKVLYMSCQLHHFQNVGDLAGDIVHSAAFQFLIDFAPKRQIVGHSAVRCKESTISKDDFPAVQKFITEQCLIDICAVKPDGHVPISRFPFCHGLPPPLPAVSGVLPVGRSCRPFEAYPQFSHEPSTPQRLKYLSDGTICQLDRGSKAVQTHETSHQPARENDHDPRQRETEEALKQRQHCGGTGAFIYLCFLFRTVGFCFSKIPHLCRNSRHKIRLSYCRRKAFAATLCPVAEHAANPFPASAGSKGITH